MDLTGFISPDLIPTTINFTGFISPDLIPTIIGVLFIIFLVVSIVLIYHWQKYAVTHLEANKIKFVYFFVSGTLWLIILSSALTFLSNIK